MLESKLKYGKTMIERKIRYDSSIVEYRCKLLHLDQMKITLLHKVEKSFVMSKNNHRLKIPVGAYTFAYYWLDQPYNLYFWREPSGKYLGSYFNIVRKNDIQNNLVLFEDLIIDLVVKPDGTSYILDQEELPLPLQTFENGYVDDALKMLLERKDSIIEEVKAETKLFFR